MNMGHVGTFNFYRADNVCEVAQPLTISRASLALVNNKAEHLVTEPGRWAAEAVVSDAVEFTSTDSISFFDVEPDGACQPLLSLKASDCLDVADLSPVIGPVVDARPASYGLFVRKQEGGWIDRPEP